MTERFPEINIANLPPWGGLLDTGNPDATVALAGVPIEYSAFYRAGAAAAPARIRRLSAVMPPLTESGRLLNVRVHDIGDANLEPGSIERNIESVAQWLLDNAPDNAQLVLGGDHTAAIPSLLAQRRRHGDALALVTFDAHPDLCDVAHGERYSIGCAIRRAMETTDLPAARVTMVGLRDFDAEEVEYIRATGINAITMAEAARLTPAEMQQRLRQNIPGGAAVHLSLDIDVLDPAFAPGTEIPSAGGASSRQVLDWMAALSGLQLVGMDVVEVSPPLDHADITTLAALKFIFEFFGLVSDEEHAQT